MRLGLIYTDLCAIWPQPVVNENYILQNYIGMLLATANYYFRTRITQMTRIKIRQIRAIRVQKHIACKM